MLILLEGTCHVLRRRIIRYFTTVSDVSRCPEIAFCDWNRNPALSLLTAEALRPFIRHKIWLGFRVCQTFYGLRHYCACTSVYYARTVVQINDRIQPDSGYRYMCVYVCIILHRCIVSEKKQTKLGKSTKALFVIPRQPPARKAYRHTLRINYIRKNNNKYLMFDSMYDREFECTRPCTLTHAHIWPGSSLL